MLRKTLSRWSSRADDTQHFCAFSDNFWQNYHDSLTKSLPKDSSHILLVNTRKYNASLLVVATVKALFSGDLPQPSIHEIIACLKSPFTQGDVVRTYHLIRFFQVSDTGYFITNDGHDRTGACISLVGAENWENVMCYLDALLFSMFANLESFEPILFILNQHANPLVTQLAGLLRVYVNLLRLGNLITTDITQRLCECLMKLGFTEAMSHRQQDSAPLFEFLTETLAMPLLTFRVEIQHSGKQDDDDTKYSKERILFVSVPEPEPELLPEDNSPQDVAPHEVLNSASDNSKEPVPNSESTEDDAVLLEECLEHYFNNSISVRRELQRRATLDSRRTFPGEGVLAEGKEWNWPDSADTTNPPPAFPRTESSPTPHVRVRTRSSTLSIWSISSVELKPREVMLPAWMLLRLLPFYTDDNEVDGANESIARNSREFANRRPVLPICLKRYSFANNLASRSQRRIIIPPVIDLPLFVADDPSDTISESMAYRLVLESAVCHRGTSIESGHFVSAVRKNIHEEPDSLDDWLAAEWYLYDDMKKTRVVTKLFRELFDTEWPYMLFYRLVAVNSATCTSSQALVVTSNVSPVMAPKGFKQRYWAEESLTPIVSASERESSRSAETFRPLLLRSNSTNSSVPIPEYLPSSLKFVDIRKRYLWYVIDKDKNYYKETASLSKSGSRSMSISITPQFRRNSQWSDISNISGLALEEPTDTDENLNQVKSKLQAYDGDETPVLRAKSEEVLSPVISEKSKHHVSRIFNHDREHPASLLKKQYRKKQADYRREKCCIT